MRNGVSGLACDLHGVKKKQELSLIKKIKRILWIIAAVAALAVSGVVYFTVRYQDEIIRLFIAEANKHILTPVDVKKVEFSMFRQFPDITISLKDVEMAESFADSKRQLLRAGSLRFTFSLWDVLHKRYRVQDIRLEKGAVLIRYDAEGNPNYKILSEGGKNGRTFFDLENIVLEDVQLHYEHDKTGLMIDAFTPSLKLKIRGSDKQLDFDLNGQLNTGYVKVKGKSYFRKKSVKIDTRILYLTGEKRTLFENGNLNIDGAQFSVTGDVKTPERTLRLDIKGRNTTFNTLLSLLPEEYARPYRRYRTRGKVYFNALLDGRYDLNHGLNLDVSFGSENASFYHPEFKKGLEEVCFKGRFLNGREHRLKTFELRLDDFSCKLDGRVVTGKLLLSDFNDYYLKFDVKGLIDVQSLLDIFPNEVVRSAYGRMNIDLRGKGRLSDLNIPKRRNRFNTEGEVDLQNVSFVLYGERLPFNAFTGSFIFNKSDLAISNFTGRVGSSDFELNGFFKYVTGWLFSKNRRISIDADLHSEFLDFDELLMSNFASRDTTRHNDKKYQFRISPDLGIRFNCMVSKVKFRRFTGRDIRGDLIINDRIATFNDVRFRSAGGTVRLSGSVSNKDDNRVEVVTDVDLDGIAIDSLFYIFNNFSQTWIIDRNLRGQITAGLNAYLRFSKYMKLDTRSLIADIHATVNNGQLIEFEPAQRLSAFIESETLSHLKFSKMENDIRIADQKVFIPEMDIRTNVSDITISGTHTFDQRIDYHLAVPLMLFLNEGRKKRFAEDAVDGGKLLLVVNGTTSDYKVSYDTKAFTRSIKNEISNEGKEWRELLHGKGGKDTLKNAEPVPEEEEYFDFDEAEKKDGGGGYLP